MNNRTETLELIRALLAPYEGQPSTAGDAFKIADAALANNEKEHGTKP